MEALKKNAIDKKIKIISYYDVYKNLLSSNQKSTLSLYCEEDLSLGEIAQMRNISRQAVWDSLSRGIEQLEKFESILHIVEKDKKIDTACCEILKIIEENDDISVLKTEIQNIVKKQLKTLQEE